MDVHALTIGLVRSRRPVPRWAVVSAGLSPVLLTAGWLVAGAFQSASYSPIHETVSVLAGHAGTDRWIMTSALFLVGCCNFVAAAGLTGVRLPARILLVVAGLSSIGIAVSPEPVVGSTPQHLAWTSLGEVTIAVWPAFTGRRGSPRPLILSIRGAATVTAVSIALLGWLVIETQSGSVLGLAERLTSSVQITWPFIVALALRRTYRPALAAAQTRPPAAGADHAGICLPKQVTSRSGSRDAAAVGGAEAGDVIPVSSCLAVCGPFCEGLAGFSLGSGRARGRSPWSSAAPCSPRSASGVWPPGVCAPRLTPRVRALRR